MGSIPAGGAIAKEPALVAGSLAIPSARRTCSASESKAELGSIFRAQSASSSLVSGKLEKYPRRGNIPTRGAKKPTAILSAFVFNQAPDHPV